MFFGKKNKGGEKIIKEYTFTNNTIEFVVRDVNHLSAEVQAENLQRNICDLNPVLTLIRVKTIQNIKGGE